MPSSNFTAGPGALDKLPVAKRTSSGSRHLVPIFTVVLTGGIASGKSTATRHFAELGVPVIDTDEIAHRLVEPGEPALESIIRIFGNDFLLPEGGLNRALMREAIFSNPKAKLKLEAILHPAIHNEVGRILRQLDSPYCLLVIPLFTESKSYDWVDRVLLVDIPEEIQVKRVMSRDDISEDLARAIIESQASREQRLLVADDVIDNQHAPDHLKVQVKKLHSEYLRLAAGKKAAGNDGS